MSVSPLSSPARSTTVSETSQQFIHTLANGLTVVAERIPGVRSAAMTFLVPAGAASDPIGAAGSATVLSDWILRGAGKRDSRELTSYLDGLGVQRSASADNVFLRFSAAMLGKNLLAVLPVYGDIVREPHLPEEGFDPSVDLAMQQLDAIEDEPSHKLSFVVARAAFSVSIQSAEQRETGGTGKRFDSGRVAGGLSKTGEPEGGDSGDSGDVQLGRFGQDGGREFWGLAGRGAGEVCGEGGGARDVSCEAGDEPVADRIGVGHGAGCGSGFDFDAGGDECAVGRDGGAVVYGDSGEAGVVLFGACGVCVAEGAGGGVWVFGDFAGAGATDTRFVHRGVEETDGGDFEG